MRIKSDTTERKRQVSRSVEDGHASLNESLGGYARAGRYGTVRFEPHVNPDAEPAVKRGRKTGRPRCKPHHARGGKLLKLIQKVPQRAGVRGERRVEAQLSLGTKIIAILASYDRRPRDPQEMRDWAKRIPASLESIEHHIKIACETKWHDWPTPREIGNALEVTEVEWNTALNRSGLIYPFDVEVDEEVKALLRDKAKENWKRRSAAYRRRQGATPRKWSAVEVAKRLGKHPNTIRAWIRAGKLNPDTGELLEFVTPHQSLKKQYYSRKTGLKRKRDENYQCPGAAPQAPAPVAADPGSDATPDASAGQQDDSPMDDHTHAPEPDGESTATGAPSAEATRAAPRSEPDTPEAWLAREMEARRKGEHLTPEQREALAAMQARAARQSDGEGPSASPPMDETREAGGASSARRSHRIVYSGHNRRPDHAA